MPFRPGESGNPAGRPKGVSRVKMRSCIEVLVARGVHPIDAILDLIDDEEDPLRPGEKLRAYQLLLEYTCTKPTLILGFDPDQMPMPRPEADLHSDDLLARIEARKHAAP